MKIKPCPFCGGEGILYTGVSCNCSYAKVYCDKCKTGTKEVFDKLHNGTFVKTAVEMWNKRAGEQEEEGDKRW